MRIMTIDPGTNESAWLFYNASTHTVEKFGFWENGKLKSALSQYANADAIVCEGIQSYGMPVGKETFETCFWIGRFWEACHCPFELFYRSEVKLLLCGSSRAKDANIRQACLDAFDATGGGKTPQVGTKSQPGPLFGVSKHIWSALAIALAWNKRRIENERKV